jgi:Tol biopolymer transport system component/DNA-binding winged helix-turn-helix (wHTH) protein
MTKQAKRLYAFGPFHLDASERLLLRDGKPVPLAPKAFATLVLLVERQGKLVEKDELMRAVWPDAVVEENNLNKYISALRRTLGEADPDQTYIETVPKLGYRFVAPVRELGDAGADLELEREALPPGLTGGNGQATVGLGATHALATARSGLSSGLLALAIAVLLIGAAVLAGLSLRHDGPSAAKSEMTVERLTYGGYVHSATLSPDGKYFVYAERDGETSRLWLRQTEQGNPLQIIAPSECYILGTTFSPDGQSVYFVIRDKQDQQGALYRVPALGGPQTKLLVGINSPVACSPDGRQLAFIRADNETRESRLVIAASDGSNGRVLAQRRGMEQFGENGPAWSPDGRQIAVVLFTGPTAASEPFCRLVGVDAQSGALRQLTAQRWDECGRLAWAGDGRGLILLGTKLGEAGRGLRDQVWYVTQPGGEAHRITAGSNRYLHESLGLTADSSALLAVSFSRASQIWAMDARGDERTAIQLTAGTGDGRAGLAELPDGRVVFIRRTGEHVDLWQMNADGTEQKQLTTDPPFLEELRATPGGRYLIFASNRAGRSHLFRVDADGKNLRQLTGGDSSEIDADCSPDGQWLVYASTLVLKDGYGPTSLWRVSIDGGTPVRLTEQEASTPHFSPDGKYISYVYLGRDKESRLALISAEGGTPLKTFATVQTPELNIGCRFTPDGQALSYLVRQKATINIWLQPLDGSSPRPLTHFQGGELYNYLFSRDGTRLFLARGYDLPDVTLIKNFSR